MAVMDKTMTAKTMIAIVAPYENCGSVVWIIATPPTVPAIAAMGDSNK